MNKSKKIIGGTLKPMTVVEEEFVEIEHAGAVHLLPPPINRDVHQAIEIILDIIYGEEKKFPPWRKDIDVPKIGELEQNIKNKMQEIERIQQGINLIQTELQKWESYRDLFTESGDNLEKIVQKTLADIGIKTKKNKKGFPCRFNKQKSCSLSNRNKKCFRCKFRKSKSSRKVQGSL